MPEPERCLYPDSPQGFSAVAAEMKGEPESPQICDKDPAPKEKQIGFKTYKFIK